MILILCQGIENGEESGRVREGVREKVGFEVDHRGQGPGIEDRWEGISVGGNSRGQSLGWVGAPHIHRGGSARWMPAGNSED